MVRAAGARARLERATCWPIRSSPACTSEPGRAITNFAATLPPADSDLAQQATKDPYLFDFLAQTDRVAEADLERGLIEHVQQFLLELGQGFAFVGRQVRLQIGRQDFYADLLFYHLPAAGASSSSSSRRPPSSPGHVGQLGMYMSAVDDLLAQPDDKPTIGLLLCKTRDNVVAEYALRGYDPADGRRRVDHHPHPLAARRS